MKFIEIQIHDPNSKDVTGPLNGKPCYSFWTLLSTRFVSDLQVMS